MGWWEQNEEGVSFAMREDGPAYQWGDGPADIVDEAITRIAAEFVADLGRLPSKGEIMAGLTFSTQMLAFPDRPEDCPVVAEEDRTMIGVHRDEGTPEAEQAIGEVIDRLTAPYQPE